MTFFDWWRRQVEAALPWARPPQGKAPDALIIEVEQFGLAPPVLAGRILARRDGSEEFVTQLTDSMQIPQNASTRLKIGLRLPASMALHRKVVFPVQALHNLKTAIGFEMDRLTPFNIRDVLWSIYELRRGPSQLKLSLLIVKRSTAEPLLAALAGMRLVPSFIESGAGRLQLRQVGAANPLRDGLLALCCALVLGIVCLPLARQQHRIAMLDQQFQALAPVQQELSSLEQQMTNFGSSRAIAAAAKENGDQLQILAKLTRALPDGTWLSGLNLTRNGLVLTGQSDDAALLISVLGTIPGLRDPGFIGPVTRTDDGSAELFSIQALISK